MSNVQRIKNIIIYKIKCVFGCHIGWCGFQFLCHWQIL